MSMDDPSHPTIPSTTPHIDPNSASNPSNLSFHPYLELESTKNEYEQKWMEILHNDTSDIRAPIHSDQLPCRSEGMYLQGGMNDVTAVGEKRQREDAENLNSKLWRLKNDTLSGFEGTSRTLRAEPFSPGPLVNMPPQAESASSPALQGGAVQNNAYLWLPRNFTPVNTPLQTPLCTPSHTPPRHVSPRLGPSYSSVPSLTALHQASLSREKPTSQTMSQIISQASPGLKPLNTQPEIVDLTLDDRDSSEDDLIIDEESTNRSAQTPVCIGSIMTNVIVTQKRIFAFEEGIERLLLRFEGSGRLTGNYTIKVYNRHGEHFGFVPWNPIANTIGPLCDAGIVCRIDAFTPRHRSNVIEPPLMLILHTLPMNIERAGALLAKNYIFLRDPPREFRARYQNPHIKLAESQRILPFRPSSTPNLVPSPLPPTQPSYVRTTQQIQQDIQDLLKNLSSADDDEEDEEEEKEGEPEDTKERKRRPRVEGVEGLSIELMPHQKRGVGWMMEREKSGGGILADDMGLGKTVQTIALILGQRPPKEVVEEQGRRATLIVVPLALLRQWQGEILAKSREGEVQVWVHHGSGRIKDSEKFKSYDVVITTYQMVTQECPDLPSRNKRAKKRRTQAHLLENQPPLSSDLSSVDYEADDTDSTAAFPDGNEEDNGEVALGNGERGPLFNAKWWRVVLDEGHAIKNKNTRSALACCELDAEKRWILTGTPVQNNVEELYSLFKFLRAKPYSDYGRFREDIAKPMQSGGEKQAMAKLQLLLKSIMMRRTKAVLGRKQQPSSTHSTHGASAPLDDSAVAPLEKPPEELPAKPSPSRALSLALPARNVREYTAKFSEDELAFYRQLESRTQNSLRGVLTAAGGEESNEGGGGSGNGRAGQYINMLCLLLRLRQACNHPLLILKHAAEAEESVEAEAGMEAEAALTKKGSGRTCIICLERISNPAMSYCSTCQSQFAPWIKSPPTTSTKILRLLQVLHETHTKYPGAKVIVFSQFTCMLDLVEESLKKEGFIYSRYDGSMSAQARERSIEMLQTRAEVTVMLVSLKSGSLGLNLSAANHVILLDVWWNPAIEDQAIDRVHRIGQRHPVFVTKLSIEDTVEARIKQLQEKKRVLAKGALGDGSAALKFNKLSLQEILYLFQGGKS
ncbi:uncharacterized protein VTP21DRAFT_6217 [Calcarisporiella thermophila]|uniref:uncharacterized protein n=1 Tax=Calcarisporiella thermophila TaxID=911321 RepID=UPI0037421706